MGFEELAADSEEIPDVKKGKPFPIRLGKGIFFEEELDLLRIVNQVRKGDSSVGAPSHNPARRLHFGAEFGLADLGERKGFFELAGERIDSGFFERFQLFQPKPAEFIQRHDKGIIYEMVIDNQ